MKAIRIGTSVFAFLASVGSAAMASGGSAWITDGLTTAQHQEIWQRVSKQVVSENSAWRLQGGDRGGLPERTQATTDAKRSERSDPGDETL